MASYKITITPVIHREDGQHLFDESYGIRDVFKVSITGKSVDGDLVLISKCDSVTFWSSEAETKNVTSRSGHSYEVQDHWKLLPEGSSIVLEKGKSGFYTFKFKRDTRFGKVAEFSAFIEKV